MNGAVHTQSPSKGTALSVAEEENPSVLPRPVVITNLSITLLSYIFLPTWGDLCEEVLKCYIFGLPNPSFRKKKCIKTQIES